MNIVLWLEVVQLIGEYLEEDVGHQAQFLVAGLYSSSVAAYEDYRGLSLAYNYIDVYIKYNKNMESKTNKILSSNYDDESHLRNFIEVCYTSIQGIDKPINIIVIDEKEKEELCLKTLIDKFDINAVQAGFVVKWSSIFKRYYIDEWYRTVDYNTFLKSNILKISDISRLCKPANSIIWLLYKAQQLYMKYELPDGMVFLLAQTKIGLETWMKFNSLSQKYKMELTSRFIFNYTGEQRTPYELIVHPNYNYDSDSNNEVESSISSISQCSI